MVGLSSAAGLSLALSAGGDGGGGGGGPSITSSAELYNSASKSWNVTGPTSIFSILQLAAY